MLPFPDLFTLLAVLAIAIAAGLDAYLTMALISLAPLLVRVSDSPLLPDELTSQAPLALAAVAVLYAVELAAERFPALLPPWQLVQMVGRPVAATLVTTTLLSDAGSVPPSGSVLFAAALLALMTYGLKAGSDLLVAFAGRRGWRTLPHALGQDVLAAAIVAGVLLRPEVGALVVLGFLALIASARAPTRALAYGFFLAWARTWGSLQPFRWLPEDELPGALRNRVGQIPRTPGRRLKGARAAGLIAGSDRFRIGWIVLGGVEATLVVRAGRRWLLRALASDSVARVESGTLFSRVVEWKAGAPTGTTWIVPASGPSAPLLARELIPYAAVGSEPAVTDRVDRPAPMVGHPRTGAELD